MKKVFNGPDVVIRPEFFSFKNFTNNQVVGKKTIYSNILLPIMVIPYTCAVCIGACYFIIIIETVRYIQHQWGNVAGYQKIHDEASQRFRPREVFP